MEAEMKLVCWPCCSQVSTVLPWHLAWYLGTKDVKSSQGWAWSWCKPAQLMSLTWAWLIYTAARVVFTAVCCPGATGTAIPSPPLTLLWQSLSSRATAFSVENGKCFPHQLGRWTSRRNVPAAPAEPGLLGASPEESQVPPGRAEEK